MHIMSSEILKRREEPFASLVLSGDAGSSESSVVNLLPNLWFGHRAIKIGKPPNHDSTAFDLFYKSACKVAMLVPELMMD
jgi:hypothetical protein